MNHSAAGVICRPRWTASLTRAYASRSAISLSPSRASSPSSSAGGGASSCQPAIVRAWRSSWPTLNSSARSGDSDAIAALS
jgi:hypothetical protein